MYALALLLSSVPPAPPHDAEVIQTFDLATLSRRQAATLEGRRARDVVRLASLPDQETPFTLWDAEGAGRHRANRVDHLPTCG